MRERERKGKDREKVKIERHIKEIDNERMNE
jgi:hypothetical protein